MSAVEEVIDALRAGGLAVLPTDTVYGLAGRGDSEDVARALYRVKGRSAVQPTALLFASVELLAERLPDLDDGVVRVVRALLPGPFTLVLPNARRLYRWLNAERPEAIGVRVPALAGPGSDVLAALEMLVATSANDPGGPDPRRLEDVPAAILDAVDAFIDGGALPGTPSTVIDLTGQEPRVLREGAVSAADALACVHAARST